ncbi:unnamed protein product [Lepidochelys kempii]
MEPSLGGRGIPDAPRAGDKPLPDGTTQNDSNTSCSQLVSEHLGEAHRAGRGEPRGRGACSPQGSLPGACSSRRWGLEHQRGAERHARIPGSESRERGREPGLWGAPGPGSGCVGGVLLICTECGESFGHHEALIAHQRGHAGQGAGPFTCPQCQKGFEHRASLVAHRHVHTGERPCAQCGRGFRYKTCLAVHQRAHSGQRPHRCPQCSAAFLQRGDLHAHLGTHPGERPFARPAGGLRFPSRRALACHPGLGPHRCPQCGHSFRHKRNLVRHQRGHAGAQPYRCPQCGDGFCYKQSLVAHQREHAAPRPYPLPPVRHQLPAPGQPGHPPAEPRPPRPPTPAPSASRASSTRVTCACTSRNTRPPRPRGGSARPARRGEALHLRSVWEGLQEQRLPHHPPASPRGRGRECQPHPLGHLAPLPGLVPSALPRSRSKEL